MPLKDWIGYPGQGEDRIMNLQVEIVERITHNMQTMAHTITGLVAVTKNIEDRLTQLEQRMKQ